MARALLYTLLVALVVTIVGATWLALGSLLSQTHMLEHKLAKLERDLSSGNYTTHSNRNSSTLLSLGRLQHKTMILGKKLQTLNNSSFGDISDCLKIIQEMASNLHLIDITVRELEETVLNIDIDSDTLENYMLKRNEELWLLVSENLSRLEGELEEIKAIQLVLNKTSDTTLQKLIEYETQMLYYFNKTTISNNRIVDDFANITQTINELQKSRNTINDTLNCSVHRQSIANLEISMIEIARVSQVPLGNTCRDILIKFPNALSGFYYIRSSIGGQASRVFCNMTLSCNGVKGGWERVGYLNASTINYQCPPGFTISNNSDTLSCEATQEVPGCSSVFYNLTKSRYTEVWKGECI